MNTNRQTNDHNYPDEREYALRRGLDSAQKCVRAVSMAIKRLHAHLARALEAVLEDEQESEPVKAEALRELEEVTEFLRKSPWRSRGGAERCVRAVTAAIKRLHVRLAGAVDAEGKPHPVLQAFARHLYEHLLLPSGRGGGYARGWPAATYPGCFTYEPPTGVVWDGKDGLLPQ